MPDDDALAALVARAKRGEPAAFEALARRFLRPAYAVALSIVTRPSDAEDVAQEALILQEGFPKVRRVNDQIEAEVARDLESA